MTDQSIETRLAVLAFFDPNRTLSFLVTTPDVFSPTSPPAGFLMKDVMLLGRPGRRS